MQHEPARRLSRQRGDGSLFLVKFELADRFERRDDAQRALFVYIEVVDHQRRRHSTIDDVSLAIEHRARSAEMSER